MAPRDTAIFWRFDVLRLLVSIELAAELIGADAKQACRTALEGWSSEKPGPAPHPVRRLLERAAGSGVKKLYAKRLVNLRAFSPA